jgi:hypothetical protein
MEIAVKGFLANRLIELVPRSEKSFHETVTRLAAKRLFWLLPRLASP